MKKKIITVFLIAASIMFMSPMNTMALESNNISIIEKSESNILTNTVTIAAGEPVLGDVNDEDSVAWLVQLVLNIVKVVGPILVILMTILDLVKVTAEQKQDGELKKIGIKTLKRVIYAVILFALPTLITVVFEFIGLYGTCIS